MSCARRAKGSVCPGARGTGWSVLIPDDDALVLPVDHHVAVHVVCQSVDVRRVLILGLGR